jgi:selenocysteine lyase/cysteine desulfurase
MTFEEARAAFPVLERYAYLNAGSVGPLPRAAAAEVDAWSRRELEEGRGSLAYFKDMLDVREHARGRLGELIGVPRENVALTSATTDACNIVAAGLRLGPDDDVVTTDVEHFGLTGPLHASGARVRVARVKARPAAEALELVLAAVTPRTRLLALSHVAWTTGQVLPIAELRRETGLPVLVDGAQSVGAIPVDASGFDFYTVSGQKWLCGPVPTGALFVADPEGLHVAAPTYLSQVGYEPDGRFEPREGAARFDSGWIPPGYLSGLLAAIDGAPEWRFERAREAAERCRVLLAERYEVVTEPGQATLVTFRADGDPSEVAGRLLERGVIARDLPGTGWLRVSCGYWTSDEDLERLLDALAGAAR